jgi:hypothetical protein
MCFVFHGTRPFYTLQHISAKAIEHFELFSTIYDFSNRRDEIQTLQFHSLRLISVASKEYDPLRLVPVKPSHDAVPR